MVDDTAAIHRVIVTVRSDFEPQVSGGDLKAAWNAGRCTVPPFSLEELKEIIVMPTMQEVLIFDPPDWSTRSSPTWCSRPARCRCSPTR